MNLRRMTYLALAVMLAIVSAGLTGYAQQAPAAKLGSQDLNLSDAQVFRIHALLLAQTKEIQTLHTNVQSAEEALAAAIAKGDPMTTEMAVLALDAAEKALKNTQQANQRNLLSLLNDYQKQIVKEYSNKSLPASE